MMRRPQEESDWGNMGGTRRIIDEGQASAPAKSILSHEMKYVVCICMYVRAFGHDPTNTDLQDYYTVRLLHKGFPIYIYSLIHYQ